MLRTCEGGGAGVTDRSANILIPTLTIAASLRAVFLAPLPKRSWISLAAGAWHAATRTWAAAPAPGGGRLEENLPGGGEGRAAAAAWAGTLR